MIFLLGHNGFVGSAFARYFKKNRIKFAGIDRENYEDFRGKKCNVFINAGGSSKKRLAEHDPKKDFELNVLSTFNTLHDFHFNKYVLLSSVDVYNEASDPRKNTEDTAIDTSTLSNYGMSKFICEQLVRKYCSRWLIFRLGGMIGEGLKKNAIYDLINTGTLYVNPRSEYQYINTEEVASIVHRLSRKKKEIFNLCGDGTVRLEDVAKIIGTTLDRKLYRLKREKYNVNVSKIKKLVNVEKTEKTVLDFCREKTVVC